MVSYTPRLSHLFCLSLIESNENIELNVLKLLSNLVHLTISIHDINFDTFEELLVKLSSQSKLLTLTFQCWDRNYLDGHRWKEIILRHIPQLKKFMFCYSTIVNENFQIDSYYALVNGFISPFWIKRQWIFHLAIYNEELTFLVRPHRYIFKQILHITKDFSLFFSEKFGTIFKNIHTLMNILKKLRPMIMK
jgi:hypothetical protein